MIQGPGAAIGDPRRQVDEAGQEEEVDGDDRRVSQGLFGPRADETQETFRRPVAGQKRVKGEATNVDFWSLPITGRSK